MLLNLNLDGKIKSIYHTKNDSLSDVVQADELILVYGKEDIDEKLLGLKFKIGPFSFFQTNSRAAERLSLIHISEPTRRTERSRMPSSA